jgi:hypothetical protein
VSSDTTQEQVFEARAASKEKAIKKLVQSKALDRPINYDMADTVLTSQRLLSVRWLRELDRYQTQRSEIKKKVAATYI